MTYDDLIRLHNEYNVLLVQYLQLLIDELECRLAVEGVLHNMEVLKVAVDEIYEQVLDVADPGEVSNAMSLFVKGLS